MKKNILYIALLTSCFFTQNVASQGSSKSSNLIATAKETVYLHANTTTLLTGESFYYSLYCVNMNNYTASPISKIAYIELIDAGRTSVLKQKVLLKKGIAQGDFFIPTTLKTGNYKLVAYTNWMLNGASSEISQTDIAIINPFQPSKEFSNQELNSIFPVEKRNPEKTSNDVLAIETSKKTFASREQVNITVKPAANIKGNYSLSVRKIDALEMAARKSTEELLSQNKNHPAATASNVFYIPEYRGEVLTGKIVSKSKTTDVYDKSVALSVPGKSFGFKIVNTDKSGKFIFTLDEHPNTSGVIIQVVADNREDYAIEMENWKGFDLSQLNFPPNFSLNANYKKAIENRSTANQIENAYYTRKRDSLEAAPKQLPFYNPLQKDYILDDYERFSSFKETIIEITRELFYREKNGKYSLHIRNNTTNDGSLDIPLVMVDGLMIQDNSELFNYNTNNIYKISIISKPYIYGSMSFSGIISIITKSYDYQTKASGDFIKKTEISRPVKNKKYHSPKYDGSHNLERIPDYRYQLLWLPELAVANEPANVSFYTSDVKGTFEVILEGFTENGKPVSLRDYIEVQ
ncbi:MULTISPECIES: hypothetical protein [Flavobacterium]|uniref:hypothetical protein n=1 Tax=Flavobacterium TaxID=237 RepID=UPI00086AF44E|nr:MULTISPECIES: hypothetical protein [Flavobacterium]MBN9284036.1 hypothetical protein [Flavobacterium sp.]ODS82521.1 MAG: hypothetical protein ABS44_18235 [Chryseobacterium sp. SCN 40-13]OJV73318.1 MAG: hypothetical protein BGO42_09090 [Flavobacterium sp. 40-81]